MAVSLNKGDKVMVSLPPTEVSLQGSPLWHFEGIETTIRKVKRIKCFVYYELNGVKSKYGVHYALIKDWLIPVR